MKTPYFEDWVDERWGHVEIGSRAWLIASLGLAGECGEVTEHLKKHYRDNNHPGDALKKELGDVLHYLIVIAHSYGWDLQEIMAENVCKLELRDKAGKT